MINKEDKNFAVTRLTRHGYEKILHDNQNFDFVYYSLIDDEINYNLINDDYKIAQGFDRIVQTEEDKLSDINSQMVLPVPSYWNDIGNILFGDFSVPIAIPKTEQEAQTVKNVSSINLTDEIKSIQNEKTLDFSSETISGNVKETYNLSDNDLETFAELIDIRGTIHHFENGVETLLEEDSSVFTNLTYTIQYHSNEKPEFNFSQDTIVNPLQTLEFSIKKLKSQLNITGHNLFGEFTIFKTFLFEGVSYVSDTLTIILNELPILVEKPVLQPSKIVFDLSNEQVSRKLFYCDFDFDNNKLDPRIYSNYANNQIFIQPNINGYVSLKNPLTFTIKCSSTNFFHIVLENIITHEKITIFSLEGSASNYPTILTTLKNLQFSLILYKQFHDNGYYLVPQLELPNQSGYANLSETTDSQNNTYTVLDNPDVFVNIFTPKNLYLGTEQQYESLTDGNNLWQLYSTDNNLLFNTNPQTLVTLDNFEYLVIDVLN